MRSVVLILIIYIAFISLGLPDSILGVAWPKMRDTFNKPLEAAGIITIFLTSCSTLSSFLSGRVLCRFGTGTVVMISCFMTGLALLGYSLVPTFLWLVVMTLPLGFGAGSVDSGLNHYIARHYSSRHMNWLHCFWGLGATLGPIIMTTVLAAGLAWNFGFRIISFIQLTLACIFLLTLRFWQEEQFERDSPKMEVIPDMDTHTQLDQVIGFWSLGAWLSILFFFIYAATEFSIGLWGYSLMIESRGIQKETAGFWIAVYYGAITIGRFLNGIIVDRLGNPAIVRIGLIIALTGSIFFFFPYPAWFGLISFILLGLGLAPLYPCMMHETPRRFDAKTSRVLIGYQVGSACIGSSLIPAGIGLAASTTSLEIVSLFIGFFVIVLFMMSEKLNIITLPKR